MTSIQRTASALLALSDQLVPPVSPRAVAAYLGVDIEATPLPDSLPGFTARIGKKWYIWVNSEHPRRQRRWTIGHELGHIALGHRGVAFLTNSGREHLYMSMAANRFSAELLMPEDMTRSVDPELSPGDLADIFLVDREVVDIRIQELGL